ncbi:MAG: TatD family hydrolase, partial [Pseudomonadota bacterium]
VNIDLEHFDQVSDLADRYPQVSASVGVHPSEREGREPEVDELLALADDPQVVAIGETGLDYYYNKGDLGWQQQRFRRHVAAAREINKPLIIHMRDATADTLRILEEEGAGDVGGVMHCFVEDWDTARAALDLGMYISLSGIVTFHSAGSLRAVAARMPANRLLIETDSPYLAPVPHRGKSNQPAWVRHVAECIANVRETGVEEIAEITTRNYVELFGELPA